MQLHWVPDSSLPQDGIECGHGVALHRKRGRDGRVLLAFVDGFAWYHDGADATVRFHPARIPADPAAFAALQSAIHGLLAARTLMADLPPDLTLTPNG